MKRSLPRVMVIGGGELGSAVTHRLIRCGFDVVVVDIDRPRCIRRRVCFATAAIAGKSEVEGIRAEHVGTAEEASRLISAGKVPLLTLDYRDVNREIRPEVVVDARMTKTGSDISGGLAPLVIGLGPGLEAGGNVDVVVETKRGHDLGRVIYEGSAAAFTGIPGAVGGVTGKRVIRAPESGIFNAHAELGTLVDEGCVVGVVGESTRVLAPIPGLLRGLIADGTEVRTRQKIGDVDPRGRDVDACTISDKGRAVAGGVLEAIMHWWTQ